MYTVHFTNLSARLLIANGLHKIKNWVISGRTLPCYNDFLYTNICTCMYVGVFVYVCVCRCVCMYVCLYVGVFVCMCACM